MPSLRAITSTILFVVSIVSPSLCDHEIDPFLSNIIVDTLASSSSVMLFFPSAASISAILCAKTESIVGFSRLLSKKGISIDVNRYLDVTNLERSTAHQTIILLDYDCPWSNDVLTRANESSLFAAPWKWLIIQDLRRNNNNNNDNAIYDNFRDFDIYPDSEVTILRITSNDYADLLSIYRPSPIREMIVERRGFWKRNDDGGILAINDRIVASRRRKNLRLTTLRSSIVVTNPDTLKHLTDYRDKHVDTITKCNYVWLRHLVDAMNATLNVSTVNSWGYRDKNGTWNGMMGELSRREIDIGGTSMFLVDDRWNDADYVPLSTPTRAAFVFRQPPLSFVSNLFTLPFRRSVWFAVCLLLIIIFLLLVLTTRWEWRTCNERDDPLPSLADELLLVVGAVAQQGSGRNPLTVSSRIVILMLLMAILNLYASYSANIVALLQSTTKSIGTLKDLLDSPIKCGAQDIVYNRYYFNLEKDPMRRAMIDRKIEPKIGKTGIAINSKTNNWLSADDGINNVRAGFFAFFMELGPAYKIIQETFEEDEKCGFREIYFIEHFDPTFTIVKRSPYVEIIRVNSLKIEESGLKSREILRLYTKRPQCNGRSKFVSVGLRECYFAFYTMLVGALIALGVFFVEIAWTKSVFLRRRKISDGTFNDGEDF